MILNFGYVAMSMSLNNASPSQTMTATQFAKIQNKEAGLKKLERIANSNIENCLRLLKHNLAHEIYFFRLSSRLVPLVNHELTEGWRYDRAIAKNLKELGDFALKHKMRIDFHPDHFVVLNSEDKDIFNRSLQTLLYHYKMLTGMGIDRKHRCVLHIGGKKEGKMSGLETFVENFGNIPQKIAQMIMIENDDKVYNVEDALYIGEKLGIPVVFDLHHHDVNYPDDSTFLPLWERVVDTWSTSELPIKIHISSPLEGEGDLRHHNYIDKDRFLLFLKQIYGTCDRIDVMIEAKMKDKALIQLVKELKKESNCEFISNATMKFQL